MRVVIVDAGREEAGELREAFEDARAAFVEVATLFKDDVEVTTVLHPAWTTDWISDSGKDKLRAYGIAPPAEKSSNKTVLFAETVTVPCPLCDSEDTEMISQFGSTACKSLYKCNSCKEPFDYFKCH